MRAILITFTHTHTFAAGLDQLWRIFGDADYPRRKYLSLGAHDVQLLRFEASPQVIEVDLLRDAPLPEAGLPAWARRMVRDPLMFRHRSAWRRLDARHAGAKLEIQPTGLPVRAEAEGPVLAVTEQTTRIALSWRVSSGVALLGNRIERLFAAQLGPALDADDAFTAAYLEEHR